MVTLQVTSRQSLRRRGKTDQEPDPVWTAKGTNFVAGIVEENVKPIFCGWISKVTRAKPLHTLRASRSESIAPVKFALSNQSAAGRSTPRRMGASRPVGMSAARVRTICSRPRPRMAWASANLKRGEREQIVRRIWGRADRVCVFSERYPWI